MGIAGVYAATNLLVSLLIAFRERDMRFAFLCFPIVFVVRHLVHGIGTLYGLLLVLIPGDHWKGRRSRSGPEPCCQNAFSISMHH